MFDGKSELILEYFDLNWSSVGKRGRLCVFI